MSELTNRIEILLKQKQLNRAEFCRQTNINEAAFRKWKNGSIPGADSLYKVAHFFGVSMEYLVSGEEELINPLLLLSFQEQKLIEQFRKLDERDRNSVITLASGLLEQNQKMVAETTPKYGV